MCFISVGIAQDQLCLGSTEGLILSDKGKDYTFEVQRGHVYKIDVNQKGLDVVLEFRNQKQKLLAEIDSPSGSFGTESYILKARKNELLSLKIYPFEDQDYFENGHIDIRFLEIEKDFVQTWKKDQQLIENENRKNVQTLDIQHFWEAYDALLTAETVEDSIETVQRLYIDRATEGFRQFMQVRPDVNAANFIQAFRMFPKFYASLRANTDAVFRAEKDVDYVFNRFSEIYDDFKPFKVCFLIGILNTGGTVTDDYVLIGADITCSTASLDLSEFSHPPFDQLLPHLSYSGNIGQKIRNIVAHECVHTQQPIDLDIAEQSCQLLHACLSEGFCDFVGEFLVGEQINATLADYGDQHEEEIWNSFKSAMCEDDLEDWLYNYGRFEDKPADLGYYVGYVIAKKYYEASENKSLAIKELIEFRDAEKMLNTSRYKEKWN